MMPLHCHQSLSCFFFLEQLQLHFCVSAANAFKTWHNAVLGFIFIYAVFRGFFDLKKEIQGCTKSMWDIFGIRVICYHFSPWVHSFTLSKANDTVWKWYHISLPKLKEIICWFQSLFWKFKKLHNKRMNSINLDQLSYIGKENRVISGKEKQKIIQ